MTAIMTLLRDAALRERSFGVSCVVEDMVSERRELEARLRAGELAMVPRRRIGAQRCSQGLGEGTCNQE